MYKRQQQRITYTMLAGLGCHTLSAVRELVGYVPEVKSVAVDGEHVIIVFQFKGFLGVYEIVNDQDIVQFDAAIEIYQHSRRMKIKHETPYLRYQPHTFEVVESTKTDSQTITYGPDYHDSFENELRYYHDCIESGKMCIRDRLCGVRPACAAGSRRVADPDPLVACGREWVRCWAGFSAVYRTGSRPAI